MVDNNQSYISLSEILDNLQSQIKRSRPSVVNTGLPTLDLLTRGLFPGELCVIGARPGMGTSMFVFSLMSYMLRVHTPVGFFTATNSFNVQFLSRIVSAILRTKNPYTYEERVNLIRDTAIEEIPLYLNCSPRLTILSLRQNAIKLKKEKGIRCLFVESLQDIFYSEENGNAKEDMDRTCRELKILAQELDIPIVITSGLNRSPEYREGVEGKRPQLHDLRSGSAIESNADKVLLLYRPQYYHITRDEYGNDLRGRFIVIVAKNKYGCTGEVILNVDEAKCMVTDIEEDLREKEEREYKFKKFLLENENFQMLSKTFGLDLTNADLPPF